MATHFREPCLPGTGNDHKGLDHLNCLSAWFKTVPLNTRTCMTNHDAIKGRPSHELCGPHCPGPESEVFRVAQAGKRRCWRERGDDD